MEYKIICRQFENGIGLLATTTIDIDDSVPKKIRKKGSSQADEAGSGAGASVGGVSASETLTDFFGRLPRLLSEGYSHRSERR